jgi:hypothetical protein
MVGNDLAALVDPVEEGIVQRKEKTATRRIKRTRKRGVMMQQVNWAKVLYRGARLDCEKSFLSAYLAAMAWPKQTTRTVCT